MYFERVFDRGLAQASYVVGCQESGEALVVDPRRDIDIYLEIARREGLRITHVSETHIHADYLSGSRELAAATGARLLLSEMGGSDWQYRFDHEPLYEGDRIMIGNVRIEVMHTPGHTPEHITFIVTDTPAGDAPTLALTGDFIFVGDVGRPDLLEKAASQAGTQEAGARDLYRSLRKATELPSYLPLWPGHGAGSACGKSLGALPSSSLGYEEVTSWVFAAADEDEFVSEILQGQPEPPSYFGRMKRQNREGPPILGSLPRPRRLGAVELEEILEGEAQLLDARSKEEFAAGHVPGALNVQADEGFSNWAGWTVDHRRPVILLAPEDRIDELLRGLIRVGIDRVEGYLPGIEEWENASKPLRKLQQLSPQQLFERSESYDIIDVRGQDEWEEGRIEGARHIHVGSLRERQEELPRERKLLLHCASGSRSTLGASILENLGFEDVTNLEGGIEAWQEAGLPVERE